MPGPTETSPSGRLWLPRERWPVHNPGPFLACLHRAWRRCERLPPAERGLLFHRAMSDVFGPDRQDVMRTGVTEPTG